LSHRQRACAHDQGSGKCKTFQGSHDDLLDYWRHAHPDGLENVIAGSVFPAEEEQNSGDRIYFGLADVRCSHGLHRRKLQDQRREAAEKEAANRRAIDAQVLEDASA
jgi:hypothetical protein